MSTKHETEQGPWTADELAEVVNEWCESHGVRPIEGRTSDTLTVRNIHYYRGVGLITSPARGRGPGYGEQQFLELIAIRLLQARGLPHRRIEELIRGRSLEDLRRIKKEGLSESSATKGTAPPLVRRTLTAASSAPVSPAENWNVSPLDERYLLVTRTGMAPHPRQIEWIRRILAASPTELDRLDAGPGKPAI